MHNRPLWVLRSAYEAREISSKHMRTCEKPPRKRQIRKWVKVEATHLECLEDFAGNNRQPGFWMDKWILPNGIVIKSLGGAWELYSGLGLPRNRMKTINRSCMRRLPTWVTDNDEFVCGNSIRFEKGWVRRHGGIEKVPTDILHTLKTESEQRGRQPKPEGYSLHPEALVNTPMQELKKIREDLAPFMDEANEIRCPGGRLVASVVSISGRPHETAVRVAYEKGGAERVIGILPHAWFLRYVRMKWLKGLWKDERATA